MASEPKLTDRQVRLLTTAIVSAAVSLVISLSHVGYLLWRFN